MNMGLFVMNIGALSSVFGSDARHRQADWPLFFSINQVSFGNEYKGVWVDVGLFRVYIGLF